MFEIPSLTLQFVSTAYQNGAQRWKLWCVLFVHGLDMAFTLSFFCISLWIAIKMEKGVLLIFSLLRFCRTLRGPKNVHQFLIPSILSGKAKLSMVSCQTTIIIGDVGNTESDTLCL